MSNLEDGGVTYPANNTLHKRQMVTTSVFQCAWIIQLIIIQYTRQMVTTNDQWLLVCVWLCLHIGEHFKFWNSLIERGVTYAQLITHYKRKMVTTTPMTNSIVFESLQINDSLKLTQKKRLDFTLMKPHYTHSRSLLDHH